MRRNRSGSAPRRPKSPCGSSKTSTGRATRIRFTRSPDHHWQHRPGFRNPTPSYPQHNENGDPLMSTQVRLGIIGLGHRAGPTPGSSRTAWSRTWWSVPSATPIRRRRNWRIPSIRTCPSTRTTSPCWRAAMSMPWSPASRISCTRKWASKPCAATSTRWWRNRQASTRSRSRNSTSSPRPSRNSPSPSCSTSGTTRCTAAQGDRRQRRDRQHPPHQLDHHQLVAAAGLLQLERMARHMGRRRRRRTGQPGPAPAGPVAVDLRCAQIRVREGGLRLPPGHRRRG